MKESNDSTIAHLLTRLQEREDFLQSVLISSSSISIISTNPAGVIEYWNVGAERIFGYRADEVVGQCTMKMLYPPDDPDTAAAIEEIRVAVFEKKQSITRVMQEIGRDGRSIWMNITASPRFNGAGEVIGILGIGEDISEKRSVEQANKQSERERHLLAQTVASTKDLVSITDLQGAVLFVNEAFLQAYGYNDEDLLGRNISCVYSPIIPPDMGRTIHQTTLEGGWHGEVIHRRKDGSDFPVELSTSVVYNDAGSPVALVGVGRDISDRKRAEWKQSSIYAISTAAQSGKNLRQLFLTIHGIISNLLPANNLYIALYDSVRNILSFPYFVDEFEGPPPPSPPGRGLTEYVLRTGLPLFVTPEKFDELVQSGEVESVGAPSIHWLGVPLIAGEERLGVIAVQSYSEGVRFTEQDLSMLQFVSAQVAMTIHQRRSEERLGSSEKKFRMVFETADNAILLLLHGVCIDCNPRAEQILGMPRSAILGTPFGRFSPDEQPDGKHSIDEIDRALAASLGGIPTSFEWSIRRGDGRLAACEVSFNRLPLEGVQHVQAVIRDVSERKRAEMAQRLDEARVETLLRLNQITGVSMKELYGLAMKEACRFTTSRYGFLAAVNGDDQKITILSRWDNDRGDFLRDSVETIIPLSHVGAWGEAVRRRAVVVQNSFAAPISPAEVYPVAGVFLTRTLCVPILEADTLVAIAGVANKEEDYDSADERQLMMLMDGIWMFLQRQRAEETLKESLREKEILLKEIHHRVKNNLQIISSLLSLQSEYVKEVADLEIFRESQNRVKSMALIHEKLYQSRDLSRVDFSQYIQSLTTYLFRTYAEDSRAIRLALEVQSASLGVDTAIPCGLIINELVSNALKHAFVGRKAGLITVALTEENRQCTLTVKDNGVGFPKKVKFEKSESLGLQLVHTLAAQIGGTIQMDNRRGTAVTIKFTAPI